MWRAAIGTILIVLGSGAYWAYPNWTLVRLSEAYQARDQSTLEALIDWPVVRAGIKSDIRGEILKDQFRETSIGSALGTVLGTSYLDNVIDGLISPSRLIASAERRFKEREDLQSSCSQGVSHSNDVFC